MGTLSTESIADAPGSLPVISFFTGGGFLDLGFEQAGFRILWTNEINPVFGRMYGHGVTSWRRSSNPSTEEARISDQRSITCITSREVLRAAFGSRRPAVFGVIGGPPCPDFSSCGKNLGKNGKHGPLSQVFVDRICEIRPAFFVFENVAGLLQTRIHRSFLQELESYLESEGYSIDVRILNALDLGVPQDRERLFMVGIRRRLASDGANRVVRAGDRGWFPWPVDKKYHGAKTRFDWPDKARRGERPTRPQGVPLELMVYPLLNGANLPAKQANGNESFRPYSKKFVTVHEGDTKRKSFKRLHRYRYSPTVCYGHNEVHLHPWENRRLTVREAMRIQGIPDSYILPTDVPLSAKFAVVANGVPVPMAYRLAISLKGFLLTVCQARPRNGHMV